MSSNDSSDDEDDVFNVFRTKKFEYVCEEDTQIAKEGSAEGCSGENEVQSFCAVIDDLFLRKDIYGLEALLNDSNVTADAECSSAAEHSKDTKRCDYGRMMITMMQCRL